MVTYMKHIALVYAGHVSLAGPDVISCRSLRLFLFLIHISVDYYVTLSQPNQSPCSVRAFPLNMACILEGCRQQNAALTMALLVLDPLLLSWYTVGSNSCDFVSADSADSSKYVNVNVLLFY